MKKPWLFLIPVGILLLASGMGIYKLSLWSTTKVALPGPMEVNLPANMALKTFAQKLKTAGIIDNDVYFNLLVRWENSYKKFQAGLYRFSDSIAPADVIAAVTTGRVYRPVVLEFTVPEGYNLRQIAHRINESDPRYDEDEILRLTQDAKLLKTMHLNSTSMEGYLYPATYKFYAEQPTPEVILTTMVQEFFNHLPHGYVDRLTDFELTLDQAVNFASLIEKETAYDDERNKIAEVIWNRLRDNSPLGIDAALIYGITDYAGDIKSRHLVDAENKYNTRIHRGLPPTAISSPSVKSLLAVISPTEEGNYFYVLMPGTVGRHHFSKTLKEHQRFVKKLVGAKSL